MYRRSTLSFLIIGFGIALLIAGLFFDDGIASSITLQATPTSTLSPFQRLAEPTIPAQPSQADLGAQGYWLHCLPCHGDRGQGLTLEFRETYPPEEVDCWQSGCHGASPYENGFKLPMSVPALIDENALQKFTNAAVLQSYIFAAMPYWKPGSLEEADVWQITAFLLRENNLWAAQEELNASNADQILIGPPPATPTPQPASVIVPETYLPLIVGFTMLILFLFFYRLFSKRKDNL